jgi:hypothetical protein
MCINIGLGAAIKYGGLGEIEKLRRSGFRREKIEMQKTVVNKIGNQNRNRGSE